MTIRIFALVGLLVTVASEVLQSQTNDMRATATVFNTTLGETGQKTTEISTDELKTILAEGKAVLLDIRPHLEWAISHIPGALNVAAKPGMPMHLYTSDVDEVNRLTGGQKDQSLVLYCNGPYCRKSKRVADDLLAAGYTNVRRYQLGVPVWRALGGVTTIELDGFRHIFAYDRTAIFIDTRESNEFESGTIHGARNIPRGKVLVGKDVGEVKAAKDDGRLPMEDHNTRIIVFGLDGTQAKEVAEALTREAFHNVSYYDGRFSELHRNLQQ